MRTNLPVTQREYQFPSGKTLLSTTDPSSHISYANSAPMRRNGQVTGYLSVRTKPARAEVDAAEKLYARFKDGSASGIGFQRGLIEESVGNVESGSRLVSDAGQTMAQVVEQVRKVNHLIAEITTASKEQAQGVSQVGQAVAQLDEMTQQNAAMVEESSASAISMGDRAQRLVAAVKVFTI